MARLITVSALLVALTLPAPARSAPPDSYGPFEVGKGKQPDDDQLNVFTKVFLSAMREHHGDKNANALRVFFDPRYLKKHGLTDRDIPAELAPVWNIKVYHIADDRETILCWVDTRSASGELVKEAILIRVVAYEGKLCLVPAKAPDAKTGAFTPWILRTKLK